MRADGDWQAVEGVLTKDKATVGECLRPPDLEAKAQHYKDGIGSLPPQQQGS